jgi:hypothetical protein
LVSPHGENGCDAGGDPQSPPKIETTLACAAGAIAASTARLDAAPTTASLIRVNIYYLPSRTFVLENLFDERLAAELSRVRDL